MVSLIKFKVIADEILHGNPRLISLNYFSIVLQSLQLRILEMQEPCWIRSQIDPNERDP